MASDPITRTGFWTNYDKGVVLGSTLTLTNRNGAVLIAALAIFIQLIGGQSWGIIRFVVHQLRTTTRAKDGLHHQQQAVLRNDNTDISAIWVLSRMAYAWRHRSPKSVRKSLPLILVGIIHLLAFAAASILASHITTTDQEVLIIRGSYCGQWNSFDDTELASENRLTQVVYNDLTMQHSSYYVENCLMKSQSLPECQIFKKPQLNWTSTENNPCPFEGLCVGPGSLHIDSGLLDSRKHFGINGQDRDRVQWRKNTTCSPITTKGYSTSGNTTITYTNHQTGGQTIVNYTALFYGDAYVTAASLGVSDPALQNATYVYTDYIDAKFWQGSGSADVMYDIEDSVADDEVVSDFAPIAALNVSGATLTLAFATFFFSYTEPVDDAWFSAHRTFNQTYFSALNESTTLTLYVQDEPVSVLACLEQQQFCNPYPLVNKSACTSFRSIYHQAIDDDLNEIFESPRQLMVADNLVSQSGSSALPYALNKSPLLASQVADMGISLPISDRQWILEVENWFRVGLANMQNLMVDFAAGLSAPQYTQFIQENQADNDTTLRWLCENQIIQASQYINFRTFSIILIFALGVIVCSINQGLERFVGWYRSKKRTGRWRQRAWWADGNLQLQRRAFEGMGIKDWELDEWDKVPITEKGRLFSALNNWDEMLTIPWNSQNPEANALNSKGTMVVNEGSALSTTNSGGSESRESRRRSV